MCLAPQLLWLPPEDPGSLLTANANCIHEFHSTTANTTGLSIEEAGKHAHLPISPGRALTTFIPTCCLRIQLLISLLLGADSNSPLWDTSRSWHTLNYWGPQRTKMVA